jgi:hypothetical protein
MTKKRRSKPSNGETELYRHFNSDDVLLYVGITGEPVMRRVQGHRGKSNWFREIAYIKLEHFQTRALAEIAEQIAILVERETPTLHAVMLMMRPMSALKTIAICCARGSTN